MNVTVTDPVEFSKWMARLASGEFQGDAKNPFTFFNPQQFEAVLQYAMSFGAYQATSGTSSLARAREAWDDLKRLDTPVYVREYLQTQVGRLT